MAFYYFEALNLMGSPFENILHNLFSLHFKFSGTLFQDVTEMPKKQPARFILQKAIFLLQFII